MNIDLSAMKPSDKSKTSPSAEEIRTRAYFLWEQAGRPAGRDGEFWFKAETELGRIKEVEKKAAVAPSVSTWPLISSGRGASESAETLVKRKPKAAARPRAAQGLRVSA